METNQLPDRHPERSACNEVECNAAKDLPFIERIPIPTVMLSAANRRSRPQRREHLPIKERIPFLTVILNGAERNEGSPDYGTYTRMRCFDSSA